MLLIYCVHAPQAIGFVSGKFLLRNAGEEEGEPANKKQRGRPKGSKNRRMEEEEAQQTVSSSSLRLFLLQPDSGQG